MCISEAVKAITAINKSTIYSMIGGDSYQHEIAKILDELLQTGGIGTEYLEGGKK